MCVVFVIFSVHGTMSAAAGVSSPESSGRWLQSVSDHFRYLSNSHPRFSGWIHRQLRHWVDWMRQSQLPVGDRGRPWPAHPPHLVRLQRCQRSPSELPPAALPPLCRRQGTIEYSRDKEVRGVRWTGQREVCLYITDEQTRDRNRKDGRPDHWTILPIQVRRYDVI